jgi:hypothetical protein
MIIVSITMVVVTQKKAGNYLNEHPDAVTIVLDQKAALGRSITVHTVNGEKAVVFTKGTQTAFYAPPGRVVVNATYAEQHQRLTKTVIEHYGPLDATLTLEPAGHYALGWDAEAQNFTLTRA